jgi:DNA-binding response OmpR family regulator
VIDDDFSIADAVAAALTIAGFRPTVENSGLSGLRQFAAEKPDLVILDLTLPDIDGIEVCREIRKSGSVPVIMLTARADETDRVVGLELGADDYVTKPFSVKELVARVKAVLRRVAQESGSSSGQQVLKAGDIELDVAGFSVRKRGVPIELTKTELRILQMLMQNSGRVVTREKLSEAVWAEERPDEHLLEVHLSNLRRKLEDDPRQPKHLTTVRGIGYRMV